jgi:hypothetical protein
LKLITQRSKVEILPPQPGKFSKLISVSSHIAVRRFLTLLVLVCAGNGICLSQSAKTVDCPGDRVYRYNRDAVGGQVFCEHVLPGGLAVNDGPFRFWFNPHFEGSFGNYNEGREVGKWKECNRFEQCEQKDYPAVYPDEKARPGFKPEIPVTYMDGKFVFDFASCRSTSIMHRNGDKADVGLLIGAREGACFISYGPTDEGGRENRADYTNITVSAFGALRSPATNRINKLMCLLRPHWGPADNQDAYGFTRTPPITANTEIAWYQAIELC